MRAIIVLLFSGLSLASIAACAPISGDAYSKAALASACPALEGYPDCHPGQGVGRLASSPAF
jgi:hypothetical protein